MISLDGRGTPMVQLFCSPQVSEKLHSELAAVGIAVDGSGWALIERGMDVPPGRPAIVFDALDWAEVVRVLAAGMSKGAPETPTILTGQRGSTFAVLSPREVRLIEASDDGISAHTTTGSYRLRGTLQHYEENWSGLGFIRVNRSQIANLAHVKEIVPWFNSRLVLRMSGGEELEVSKIYARRLRHALKL